MPAQHFNLRHRILWLGLIVLLTTIMLVLSGCATQPMPEEQQPGFFLGFAHGFAVPVTLVASLFWDIRIYAFPNSGVAYDFGFIAGFCTIAVVIFLSLISRIGGLITMGRR